MSDLLRAQFKDNSIPRYYDLTSSFDRPAGKKPDPEEIKSRIKNGVNALRG